MELVSEAVGQALEQAKIPIETITSAAAGLTGADWPHEYGLLWQGLKKALGIDVHVVNDSIIALHAETSGPGIVVCAGSGMNCAVRSPEGATYVFGYAVRDCDQGGGALGNDVLWAVIDAHSGKEKLTALTDRLLKRYGCADADELLMRWVGRKLPEPPHHLMSLLNDTIAGGDEVAIALAEDFGRRMAAYASAALRLYGMESSDTLIVLAGGVWRHASTCMVVAFQTTIAAVAPRARILVTRKLPVDGAARMALDRCTLF